MSEGLSLLIYAEGTRSRDGHVARFKAGSFLLAIEAGLPIVPLAVIGTRQVMPKGRLRTEPADVTLVVHDPIQPPAIETPTVRDAKALADRVHAVVADAVGATVRSNRHAIDHASRCIVTAIIAAGGRGQRFGGAVAEAARWPSAAAPILERSVAAFLAHPAIDEVVVALPQALADDPPAYLRATPASRCASSPAARGGRIRSRTRFAAADAASDVIVIHDAARPFASAGSDRADDRGGGRDRARRWRRCRRATR